MARRPVALLFDLDGTLIDSVELILSAARYAFSGRDGPMPSDAQWTAGIGTPLRTQLQPWAANDDELEELLDRYRAYQREHHDRLTRCFGDVPHTLEFLHRRGHPMAVVTSKLEVLAWRSLSYVGLDRLMTVIIGCDATTRHKPDPEPVHVALARLGYLPEEAVFVGDSPHDMLAGHGAGVLTVAALWGPFTRDALRPTTPHHYIECMADLPPLLDLVFPNEQQGR